MLCGLIPSLSIAVMMATLSKSAGRNIKDITGKGFTIGFTVFY
jgi:hypothetical protein